MQNNKKRTVTSVEIPPAMMYALDRMASRLHLSKSDIIRWGIEYMITHPPKQGDAPLPFAELPMEYYLTEDD